MGVSPRLPSLPQLIQFAVPQQRLNPSLLCPEFRKILRLGFQPAPWFAQKSCSGFVFRSAQ